MVRERMRFASDLHDIQGHTLHVVKLKVALARKLVHRDPGRAEQELREIYSLVSDTITQTKELVYAQRRLNLPAELENAKNLFEAAGIKVHIRRVACTDSRAGELLGQVLRETTTNILRHAQAREVRITLSESGISIVNDGVPDKAALRTQRSRRSRTTRGRQRGKAHGGPGERAFPDRRRLPGTWSRGTGGPMTTIVLADDEASDDRSRHSAPCGGGA
ncbi:sensor histidine kinase [Streptomyces malaysiensis]|uniref:Histidine kinase n=1 Tax=Streptomyces malaysiensis subsp. samsunensis TaxID=459658 RepID=A0A9X2M247_STRMQ|nr:histidine kinase [Streptomyces samsunensis]MCQ8834211.1 histidine kinase [Streptomyces samsunensis]